MGLSGRSGSTKLRGRIDAGFEAPGRMRLEGIPPFGKPVFLLVADGPRATLVLTREDRVLAGADPAQIVEAIAGIALGPDALRTLVAGCGFPDGVPSAGAAIHASANDWLKLTLPDSTAYLLRRPEGWRLAAATRGPLTVSYANFDSGRPAVVAIRGEAGGRTTSEITLRLSDVDTNVTLDPRTFDIELPEHPVPLTLDELRRALSRDTSGGAHLPIPD